MKIAKAVVAALVAGLGSIGVALVDNSITGSEWLTAVGVALAAGYATWQVPNKAEA